MDDVANYTLYGREFYILARMHLTNIPSFNFISFVIMYVVLEEVCMYLSMPSINPIGDNGVK